MNKRKRPELSERASELVEMFLSRKIYPNQTELLDEAIELLLERQLQIESSRYEKTPQFCEPEKLKQVTKQVTKEYDYLFKKLADYDKNR